MSSFFIIKRRDAPARTTGAGREQADSGKLYGPNYRPGHPDLPTCQRRDYSGGFFCSRINRLAFPNKYNTENQSNKVNGN
jgi:hypothetical protein